MAKERKNVPEPSPDELSALLGARAHAAWKKLTAHVAGNYQGFTTLWNADNRAGAFELKFRKGGKTLCTFYAREKCFGFMLIFGREEQARFEERRGEFSSSITEIYDASKTYHDGKWMMFEVKDNRHLAELTAMLGIKRKPDSDT